MTLIFRQAAPDDLDRLVEIHQSAFPDPRGAVERRRRFTDSALGPFSDLHVAVRGGTVVAHAFSFRLGVWFGGARVQASAIATVGVAPEARGSGVATALMGHLHDRADERGDAISVLFAFRQGFYSRLGYAPVAPTHVFEISPRAIPRAWQAEPGLSVRPATGNDRDDIRALYILSALEHTGWIDRPMLLWESRFLDERRQWFVAVRGGAVVGYASWTVATAEVHAETAIHVHEIVTQDPACRRRLLGLIGAQRDQVSRVLLSVDASDPLDRALIDIDGARTGTERLEHALGTIAGGPMIRIVDLPRAMAARGYARDGELTLAMEAGPSFRLSVTLGSVCAAPASASSFTADRAALSAILYGSLSPTGAHRLGWLKASDPSTLARADELLSLPPYFPLDAF